MKLYLLQNEGVAGLVDAVDGLAPDMANVITAALGLAFIGLGALVAFALVKAMNSNLDKIEAGHKAAAAAGLAREQAWYEERDSRHGNAYESPIGPEHDKSSGYLARTDGGITFYNEFGNEDMEHFEADAIDAQTDDARNALEEYGGETDNRDDLMGSYEQHPDDDPIPAYGVLDPSDPFKIRDSLPQHPDDDPIPAFGPLDPSDPFKQKNN